MEVAKLSKVDILEVFDEIIANTVTCINDHELGTDGLGKNIRQKVLECTEASGGKNNACAHCGPEHFPDFPSHDIIERAIELIPKRHKYKTSIRSSYSVTTDIGIALDRVRIMSLRYGYDHDNEIQKCLIKLTPYSFGTKYVMTRIAKIAILRDKAAKIFAEKDSEEKTIMQRDFLSDFSEEKKSLTEFRIIILKKIKECLSE